MTQKVRWRKIDEKYHQSTGQLPGPWEAHNIHQSISCQCCEMIWRLWSASSAPAVCSCTMIQLWEAGTNYGDVARNVFVSTAVAESCVASKSENAQNTSLRKGSVLGSLNLGACSEKRAMLFSPLEQYPDIYQFLHCLEACT